MLIKTKGFKNEQEDKSLEERLTNVEEELSEIKKLVIEILNEVRK
jgi:hypothetical protein